ncbi:DUF4124 domain-containing protein [Luteimonas gilva]|uniref:DUF4124 domain-containing protein n=1 Tax=Luteimonas gilva TaxID=2572684 RepID=A0A4U5JUS1_9GAMM|nr:DUF4124 domain-containing protein [Luteimonas gilva]TKR33295.1 DUF4124 domain-containing protein [Luteimonas gilva]
MKGIAFAALLAIGVGPAWAQTVIVKCKDAKGKVIYQTEPCERGQTTTDVKTYAPVRYNPKLAEETRQTQHEIDQRRASYGNNAQAAYIPNDGRGAACESAKAYRESVLKSVGMRRTYDLLQQLDENVRRACK